MMTTKDIWRQVWSLTAPLEVGGKILRGDALQTANYVDAQIAVLDPAADRFDAHFEQPGEFGDRVELLRLGIGHGAA
jgi:hypothetical protein